MNVSGWSGSLELSLSKNVCALDNALDRGSSRGESFMAAAETRGAATATMERMLENCILSVEGLFGFGLG